VDEKLNLGEGAVPEGAALLRFRGKVDARKVLELVAGASPRAGA
jgi:hypothetical protein